MRTTISFLCAIALHSILIAQTRYESQLFSTVDITTLKYGQNSSYNGSTKELSLDLYTGGGDVAKKRACVIFCFGGAFVSGDRTSPEIIYFATYLAQRGYICASIDYRLDVQSNLTDIESESKATIRAIQDAKAAVRYLKNKSDILGLDSSKIFIGGTSAGGIIALTLGYSQYNEFQPAFQSVIDNLGGWEGNSNSLSNTSSVLGLFNFAGAIFDTTHIQKNDLPVYLNHATGDKTVPFGQGYPLNGQAKTLVYGSGSIFNSAIRQGCYAVIDSFNSAFHPAFANPDLLKSYEILNTSSISLNNFLLQVLKSKNSSSHIQTASEMALALYPNPASDAIELIHVLKNQSVNIYDGSGQLVLTTHSNQNKIDISHLQRGFYYVKVNQEIVKFIKD